MKLKLEHLAPYFNHKLKIQTPDGIGILVGIPNLMMLSDEISIHFGSMVKTANSIDSAIVKTRNYGNYHLYSQSLVPLSEEAVSDGDMSAIFIPGGCKPILRPLSDLTKEITYNGESFVPVEYFEIGDDDNGYVLDFGNNNVNLIKDLKTTAEHNLHHDLQFIPFAVTLKLIEWHFDVFGLIDQGLAIDINTIK